MPKRSLVWSIFACLVLIGFSRISVAQTPACSALQAEKKAIAEAVLRTQHPYECCDDTIQACLQQRPVCKLARRLANDVCRRAAAGQSQGEIERALARRATSMTLAQRVPIDTSQFESAGAANAKVQLVAYTCARCPFCSKLIPQLHASVSTGALRDKVRFHLRLFPIRTHQGSTEGGLALVAAQKMSKFWPFLLHIYRNFDSFDISKLPEWAESNGMDREAFRRIFGDDTTRAILVENKREGVRNHVNATPSLFINGRAYSGDLDMPSLQDVLEEEDDRMADRVHE